MMKFLKTIGLVLFVVCLSATVDACGFKVAISPVVAKIGLYGGILLYCVCENWEDWS